jgi:hypothetical protein
MDRTRWGARLDARIGGAAERAARRLSRRDALRGAVVNGTAGLAALSLGHRPALRAAEVCQCGPTRRCSSCPGAGCPPGYHLCKGSLSSTCFNNQGYRCEWPSGTWIACMNMGHGYGYRVCYDCIGKSGCSDWCTCQSQCLCCECQTMADLRAEQHRQQTSAPHEHAAHEHAEHEHEHEHEHAEPARAGAQ